jgi:hypothetical protein
MQSSNFFSHFRITSSRRTWGRIVLVAASGFLAFIFWTLPNWALFVQNAPQLPLLWQIASNRRSILYLLLKINAPLLIMGITALLLWMYALIIVEADPAEQHSEQRENVVPLAENFFVPIRPLAQQGQVPSLEHETMPTSSSEAFLPQRADPLTPLPPVLSPPEMPTNSSNLHSVRSGEDREEGENQERQQASIQQQAASTAVAFEVAQPVVATNGNATTPEPLITIRLLRDVSMTICVPGGGRVVVPLTQGAKRVQLLAYLAWRRGDLIDRDKIMEHVFGWGLRDEDATEDKLSKRFESHKKLLRRKIRELVVEQVNQPAGKQIIDPEIDPFVSDAGFWGISGTCQVEDLEEVEHAYQVIALARKDGKLGDAIPELVKDACDQLIASYTGDFLESLIKRYPGEFKSWGGRSSWARKPYTLYRDYYLDALWYSAEYEWRAGQRCTGDGEHPEQADDPQESFRRQQQHFGRAAQQYQSYTLYACNSRFDAKATFGAHGEYGERIGMSERALRRCVVLLGAIGRTDLINQVWSSYQTQMKSVSDQRWQPSKETLADVEAARAQTNGYRFGAQISQMSSEF